MESSSVPSDETSPLQPGDRHQPGDGSPRPVRRCLLVSHLFLLMLRSFIFYSMWWRVVPYANIYISLYQPDLQGHKVTTAIIIQVVLFIYYLVPIPWAVISDTKHTRYQIIYVSFILFAASFALLFLVSRFWLGNMFGNCAMGFLSFILVTCSGTIRQSLIVFVVEQLNDPDDRQRRTSLIRWIVWLDAVGRSLASVLFYYETAFSTLDATLFRRYVSIGTIFCVSLIQIPLFRMCKKFYKLNELRGTKTLKYLMTSFRQLICRYGNNDDDNDDDDDDENFWQFSSVSADDEKLQQRRLVLEHKRAFFKRKIFLFLLFFSFGPYYAAYYFANVVYPTQDSSESFLQEASQPMIPNLIIIILLPIVDVIMRKWRCHGDKTNFCLMGLGMLFGVASVIIYDKISHGNSMLVQYMMYQLSTITFYIGGYELAFSESPRHLRGTVMSAFLGLGSFLGAILCCVWFYVPSFYFNLVIMPVLCVIVCLMYVPLIYVYRDVKRRYQATTARLRMEVSQEEDTDDYIIDPDY